MKRYLMLFCATLLLLTSCGSTTERGNPRLNDSIYQYIKVVGDRVTVNTETGMSITYANPSLLSRFNTLTGSVTQLCSDPLCRHVKEDNCPFANVISTYFYRDIIYYLSSYIDDTQSPAVRIHTLCSYDPTDAKVKILHEYEELTSHRFCDNMFYATHRDADGSTQKSSIDLESGKIATFSGDAEFPSFIYDNRYYYYETSAETRFLTAFYSTNADGSDKQTLFTADNIAIVFTDCFDGRFFLWGEYGKTELDGKQTFDTDQVILHRYDIQNDEDTIINSNFSDSYFAQYDGKLYYARIVDDPPYLGVDLNQTYNAERYNWSGGIIWELDPDSGEERVFLELPDYVFGRTNIERIGNLIVIDYTNVDYSQPLDPNGDGWYDYPTEYGKLVFNPVNAEYTIYPLPEFH